MFLHVPFRLPVVACLMASLGSNPRAVYAQEPSAEEPAITIRANTRLVMVDVVVMDKAGQPVTGLKPEDFTVEENGKKQKVSIFVPPGASNRTPAPQPPGILSNRPEDIVPSGVPMVLLLDAANSSFSNQAYARTQMLKYVADHAQGRPMAILTLSDRLRVLQEFTSDPQALLAAIKNYTPESPILQRASAPTSDVGVVTGPNGGVIFDPSQGVRDFVNIQIGYNLERRTLITLDAMRSLVWMLGGLPGRKNVVWLTADLPFDLVPEDRNVSDAELLADLPAQGGQRSVGVNAAGSLAAEQRNLYADQIRQAESQLASAGVAIYPVDLRGLVSGMENSASRGGQVSTNPTAVSDGALRTTGNMVATHGTMEEVARETGGKAYINENEIKEGIALAVADEKASYSLGYYPENKKWDGKMRSIKVRVDKGDIQLRYRKGYFAIEPGPIPNHNYEQDVFSALAVDAPATQVSFRAQAKETDPGKVRVVFLVDANTLTAEDAGGNKKMSVNFYATVWGAGDKNLAAHRVTVDKAFDAETYKQILDKGMMVPIDMEVPGGAKEYRLAVLDSKTGYIGTVSGPVGQ
jgi:VWFA-related protein